MKTASITPLTTSVISALIGAGVGGWITYKVATEDTRTRMVMNAYNLYLSEAHRARSLATEGKFTGESAVSLEAATAVLMIYGSEEVICRSLAFADQIEIEPDSISGDYFDIVLKMREELIGETKIMVWEFQKNNAPTLYYSATKNSPFSQIRDGGEVQR